MLWVALAISIVALVASIVALGASWLLVVAIFRGNLESLGGVMALAAKVRSVLSRTAQFDEGDL